MRFFFIVTCNLPVVQAVNALAHEAVGLGFSSRVCSIGRSAVLAQWHGDGLLHVRCIARAIRCDLIQRTFLFRLDAGTFGTMGVGVGFAIATSLHAASSARLSNENPCKVVGFFSRIKKKITCHIAIFYLFCHKTTRVVIFAYAVFWRCLVSLFVATLQL